MEHKDFFLERRNYRGLSQAEVANELNYSPQLVSLWESGKAFPDLSIWSKYAKILEVDLNGFIFAESRRDNLRCVLFQFDSEKFSNNLKYLRKRNNLTQIDLSKLIQVNNKTIMSWEKGKSYPSLPNFIKLCNLYKLTADELYFVVKDAKSEERITPIKKKRVFVPIVLPIIIIIAIGGGVTTTTLVTLSSKNTANHSQTEIETSESEESIIESETETESESSSSSSSNSTLDNPMDPSLITYEFNERGKINITGFDKDVDEIVVPSSIDGIDVESIEVSAVFSLSSYKNKALKKFVFDDTIWINDYSSLAFNGFNALSEITIPYNAQQIIGFQSCFLLTEITIPAAVINITPYVFMNCYNLKTVKILGNNMEYITTGMFQNCSRLEDIRIPDNVSTIYNNAFEGCYSLTDIKMPTKLASLGESAFASCNGLETITLNDNLSSINYNAFTGCSSLNEIFIPIKTMFVGKYAFDDCDKLTIKCEIEEQPTTWADDWNPDNRPVIWGCTE